MIHTVVNGKHIDYDYVSHHRHVTMVTDAAWQDRVKGLLKAELKRQNVSYKMLAEKLGALGVHETEQNIANKISRGGFSAVFLIQCLEAIGCKTLHVSRD